MSDSLTAETVTISSNNIAAKWTFCPFCGQRLEPDWNRCAGCGKEIGTLAGPPISIPAVWPYVPYVPGGPMYPSPYYPGGITTDPPLIVW